MKSDWVKAKLGDVCMIERGGSPRPITDYLTDSPDGINWIKIGDALEGSKYITSTSEKIKPEGMKKSRFVKKGDFILSNSMSFGKPYILSIDGCIHDGWLVIRDKENVFDKSFLYYYLGSERMYRQFEKLAAGGVVKNLNSQLVRNVDVVIPPIEEQQRIVDELDLLTGIIDKKNAQLRDLDALAQSIFYEMFGDPAINEKGWSVKLISDLFDVGSSKRVFESEWRDAGVPFYRAREIVRLSKGLPLEDPIFIEESLFSAYKEKYGIPAVGDIMVTGVGTLGICYLVKQEDRFYFKDGNTLWFRDKHIANSRFIKDQYSTGFVKDQIKENAHGATVGTYTIVNAKKTRVICPPVELQNEYVKKVQAIDNQKLLIEKSITDTQNLLDSRMHKYFA